MTETRATIQFTAAEKTFIGSYTAAYNKMLGVPPKTVGERAAIIQADGS